jgi:catechol 2,3-dioxygenase-like lactoylglutathione lyase family enzyme
VSGERVRHDSLSTIPERPGHQNRGPVPHLAQVAFSVVNLAVTDRWFREGLGLQAAGGARWRMRGPLASAIQGLPRVASTCSWLVSANDFFQLELFQFERPLAALSPDDAGPGDIGYRRIGVWVADFDETLTKLASLGSPPLCNPVGPVGTRRACVRNPDGVYVEIMESDPLSGSELASARSAFPIAVRSVTLSVPDLARSVTFFRGLGLERSSAPLRTPGDEALWGLDGAQTRGTVLSAGGVLVEILEYLDPRGRARPDGYRICDQGILNIAFGARNRRDHAALYDRALAAGGRPNRRPVRVPGGGVVYVNSPDNFSVELLWMSRRQDRFWGFEPRSDRRRPTCRQQDLRPKKGRS